MKFVVDSLPYYYDDCPFSSMCHTVNCPRQWDKYTVTDATNPRECEYLIEWQKIKEHNEE